MRAVMFVAVVLLITINQALSLKCYRCDSQVETSERSCTLGLPTVHSESCEKEEECFTSIYSLTRLDSASKFNMTVRSCGRNLGGCANQHITQTNKYGHQFNLEQLHCKSCKEDLCNSASSNFVFSLLVIPLLVLINKLF